MVDFIFPMGKWEVDLIVITSFPLVPVPLDVNVDK